MRLLARLFSLVGRRHVFCRIVALERKPFGSEPKWRADCISQFHPMIEKVSPRPSKPSSTAHWAMVLAALLLAVVTASLWPRVGAKPAWFWKFQSERVTEAGDVERAVYRYSVVPGGVRSQAEVTAAMQQDRDVAIHYSVLRVDRLRAEPLPRAMRAYVSFRKGGQIYWTRHPVEIPQGEVVLADGAPAVRARCGNRISTTAQEPTLAEEPSTRVLDQVERSPSSLLREMPAAAAESSVPVTREPAPANSPVRFANLAGNPGAWPYIGSSIVGSPWSGANGGVFAVVSSAGGSALPAPAPEPASPVGPDANGGEAVGEIISEAPSDEVSGSATGEEPDSGSSPDALPGTSAGGSTGTGSTASGSPGTGGSGGSSGSGSGTSGDTGSGGNRQAGGNSGPLTQGTSNVIIDSNPNSGGGSVTPFAIPPGAPGPRPHEGTPPSDSVPEPAGAALVVVGLMLLAYRARRPASD